MTKRVDIVDFIFCLLTSYFKDKISSLVNMSRRRKFLWVVITKDIKNLTDSPDEMRY